LQGLYEKGAVKVAGDTTNAGTLYKVNLPEEIPLCRERAKEIEKTTKEPIDEEKELDTSPSFAKKRKSPATFVSGR